MLPSITATIRIDLADALRASRELAALASPQHRPEALRAFTRAAMELVGVAQRERFQGRGPFPVEAKKLGVRTNRLWRDLHAEPAKATGKSIQTRIGSAVEYFGLHEMGFDGTVSVRAFTRSAGKKAIGRGAATEQSVRAHTRHMRVPKREPLMAAIREHASAIFTRAIEAALLELRTASAKAK